MAQPSRRSLRAARRRGLTSPEPVSTPTAPPGHPEPRPRARNPGQAAQPASGRTPAPGITSQKTPRAGIKPETSYPNWPVDRGLIDREAGLVEPHFPADGFGQVAPRTSASLIRYWSTSAGSDSTSAAMPGSSMTRADSSGVSHWKQATSSLASPASAMARFFGVWKRSQSLARAKSRKAAARSPRLSPRSSALRTGGSRQHRQAESGQHLLSLRVHRGACLRSLTFTMVLPRSQAIYLR